MGSEMKMQTTDDRAAFDNAATLVVHLYRERKARIDAGDHRSADEIEARLMRTPCASAADFAAKYLVATCDGALALAPDDPLMIEARALTDL